MTSTTSYMSFDEKRDYEARRNRKGRSSSSVSTSSSCSSKSGYSSCSDDYITQYQNHTISEKPLSSLPRRVQFVESHNLPALPASEDGARKRSRSSASAGEEAWWAQRKDHVTSGRQGHHSEKETYGEHVRRR
ncbi:hypothetical protein HYFRA_00007074 [Hymenoscyphus fraxineus]|uniref:Uncharacterized protein n=1 Tax=Hymenoscyphus fraxineus TaxID=746836 RepID=A0A9N9KVH3_9HELO|nr:hypothetical protein HYFRA_00007074 [Hymenoscyphus fraxineus]